MILTSKDKFKKLYGKDLIIKVADVDVVQRVVSEYGDKKTLQPPFDKCGKFTVKAGYNISFKELLLFWNLKTESELIKHTAQVYLGTDKVDNLPLFDFVRLLNYARNVATIAAEQFQTLKRNYSAEEIAAGIEDMKGDDFNIIDRFMQRQGINDFDKAYDTQWLLIFNVFKIDFQNDNFQRKYADQINKKK